MQRCGFAAVAAYVVHEGGGTLHAADVLLILAVLAAAVGYAEGALLAGSSVVGR